MQCAVASAQYHICHALVSQRRPSSALTCRTRRGAVLVALWYAGCLHAHAPQLACSLVRYQRGISWPCLHVCWQMLYGLRAISCAWSVGVLDTACANARARAKANTLQMPNTPMLMIRFQCNPPRSSAIIPCQRASLPSATGSSLQPKNEAVLLVAPRLCRRWWPLDVQR